MKRLLEVITLQHRGLIIVYYIAMKKLLGGIKLQLRGLISVYYITLKKLLGVITQEHKVLLIMIITQEILVRSMASNKHYVHLLSYFTSSLTSSY